MTHIAGTVSKLTQTKQTLVHFYVETETVCKTSAHNTTLKTKVILLLHHNAWIQTNWISFNILSPRHNFFAKMGSSSKRVASNVPTTCPECVPTIRIKRKQKLTKLRDTVFFRRNQHSLSLLLTWHAICCRQKKEKTVWRFSTSFLKQATYCCSSVVSMLRQR